MSMGKVMSASWNKVKLDDVRRERVWNQCDNSDIRGLKWSLRFDTLPYKLTADQCFYNRRSILILQSCVVRRGIRTR